MPVTTTAPTPIDINQHEADTVKADNTTAPAGNNPSNDQAIVALADLRRILSNNQHESNSSSREGSAPGFLRVGDTHYAPLKRHTNNHERVTHSVSANARVQNPGSLVDRGCEITAVDAMKIQENPSSLWRNEC